jgi:hypothetical protein
MQTMAKKSITRGRDVWRQELKELYAKLPKNYKQRLIEKYPEYDSLAGAELLRNFRNGVSRDIVLRRCLDEVAADYQSELEKQKQEPETPESGE